MSSAAPDKRAGNQRTGGQILVDALRAHGAERTFCVPGESYIAALDALRDAPGIDLVVCRHESGAAMMAEAYGKMTGKPGICFVTRGPGATNGSSGVHIACQDSTPMIFFIGQVARRMLDREAFQEIDYRRMFGQMAKWIAEIEDTARIPEYVSRAFHTATAGRPGPVVLALPEDMLRDRALAPETRAYAPAEPHPAPAAMASLRDMLGSARRPFMIVGGSGWNPKACADIIAFANANGLPVGAAFRCQDYVDNLHPCYAGDVGIGISPNLAKAVKESDLLLVVGSRLEEAVSSGYTLVDVPQPSQPLVHVFPGAEELGRVYRPDLAIQAAIPAFAAAAAALPPVAAPWAERTAALHAEYLAWSTPASHPGELQLGEVMRHLRETLPDNAILCNGAGNYTVWLHRFYRHRRFGTQLAPRCGSMGYGLPAAVSAKRHYPDRPVIAFAGDGCFLMTAQELATAMMYRLPVIVIVVNNGMYGTIRMHQERNYARGYGSDLVNPDFAAFARSFGANGETVRATAEFAPALARALAADRPTVLELVLDPDALTPSRSLTEIHDEAVRRLAQE